MQIVSKIVACQLILIDRTSIYSHGWTSQSLLFQVRGPGQSQTGSPVVFKPSQ